MALCIVFLCSFSVIHISNESSQSLAQLQSEIEEIEIPELPYLSKDLPKYEVPGKIVYHVNMSTSALLEPMLYSPMIQREGYEQVDLLAHSSSFNNPTVGEKFQQEGLVAALQGTDSIGRLVRQYKMDAELDSYSVPKLQNLYANSLIFITVHEIISSKKKMGDLKQFDLEHYEKAVTIYQHLRVFARERPWIFSRLSKSKKSVLFTLTTAILHYQLRNIKSLEELNEYPVDKWRAIIKDPVDYVSQVVGYCRTHFIAQTSDVVKLRTGMSEEEFNANPILLAKYSDVDNFREQQKRWYDEILSTMFLAADADGEEMTPGDIVIFERADLSKEQTLFAKILCEYVVAFPEVGFTPHMRYPLSLVLQKNSDGNYRREDPKQAFFNLMNGSGNQFGLKGLYFQPYPLLQHMHTELFHFDPQLAERFLATSGYEEALIGWFNRLFSSDLHMSNGKKVYLADVLERSSGFLVALFLSFLMAQLDVLTLDKSKDIKEVLLIEFDEHLYTNAVEYRQRNPMLEQHLECYLVAEVLDHQKGLVQPFIKSIAKPSTGYSLIGSRPFRNGAAEILWLQQHFAEWMVQMLRPDAKFDKNDPKKKTAKEFKIRILDYMILRSVAYPGEYLQFINKSVVDLLRSSVANRFIADRRKPFEKWGYKKSWVEYLAHDLMKFTQDDAKLWDIVTDRLTELLQKDLPKSQQNEVWTDDDLLTRLQFQREIEENEREAELSE